MSRRDPELMDLPELDPDSIFRIIDPRIPIN
jgi:hypothetical protein